MTLEGSLTEFLLARLFRIGTQIEIKFISFFCFLFLKMFFGVVLYILSVNELKKKKVGYLWDLIQGPLNLASDALSTELRGTSLQDNS